jgi:DNA polymerase I
LLFDLPVPHAKISGKKHKKTLVLLDSHAILHRAYHALPDFTSPTGEPTGALYGLAAMLFKIIDELAPDHLIACYDLPGATHRQEAFEAYKATRVAADDALIAQMVRSRDVYDALSIPRLEAPGFEADDILGTLVEKLRHEKDLDIIIASGDMDTLQLVCGTQVRVYTLKKGIKDTVLYDEAAVVARYGFGPELVPDYKGLRGDPSDNIPGVRGIGEKTATELIMKFGSLETLFSTLKKDPDALLKAGIKARIVNLLIEGEDEARFSKELATIRCDAPVSLPNMGTTWHEQADLNKALTLFSELGFRTLSNRLRGMMQGNEVAVPNVAAEQESDIDPAVFRETAIALWLVDSTVSNPTLEDMLEHTGTRDFKSARAAILKSLHDAKLDTVFTDIELPLIPVVDRMEERGILLDQTYLKKLSKRYHTELDALSASIFKAAGHEFNLNSPKQLGEVLYDTMGLGTGKTKRTATGQRSTREDELAKLADKHPVVAEILEYRELQKLLSTYIDNLPLLADSTGRLHAHFSQAGTTTGRMSSQAPNLQNIPIRTTRGAAIRRAIIAPEGFQLVAADYSQIELRLAAILSGDELLVHTFAQGEDVHTTVAAQVFNVPADMVDKEMRSRAKAINFGILYGMGANALAAATKTSRGEAQTYLAEYFKRFSGIARYVQNIKTQVHACGFTETLFGRRRYFEGVHSPLPYVQAQAERMALNAPIQGTQADIIKIAMARIMKELDRRGLEEDVFLVLQVHDELVFEVRTEKLAEVVPLVEETMRSVLSPEETKGVVLEVDVEVGPNWGELTRVHSD